MYFVWNNFDHLCTLLDIYFSTNHTSASSWDWYSSVVVVGSAIIEHNGRTARGLNGFQAKSPHWPFAFYYDFAKIFGVFLYSYFLKSVKKIFFYNQEKWKIREIFPILRDFFWDTFFKGTHKELFVSFILKCIFLNISNRCYDKDEISAIAVNLFSFY